MATGSKTGLLSQSLATQLLPPDILMRKEEAEKSELDAMRRFVAYKMLESFRPRMKPAHTGKEKELMNTQYDKDKFIGCSQEEATHIWFAGNTHLIAPHTESQPVPWCAIWKDGAETEYAFFAPDTEYGDHYMMFNVCNAPASTPRPVFLKEKELEVEFRWSYYSQGTLVADIDGVSTVVIDFKKLCIHKPGVLYDPGALCIDKTWTLEQIEKAAADYARKIAKEKE